MSHIYLLHTFVFNSTKLLKVFLSLLPNKCELKANSTFILMYLYIMSPFGLSCDSLSRFCIACFMYFVNSADTREQFLVFKSFFLKCNKLLKIVCTISSFINLDVILLTAPVRALSLSSSKSILSLQFLKVLQNWFQLATNAHLDISSSIITGIVKISPILFIRKCHCIPSKNI